MGDRVNVRSFSLEELMFCEFRKGELQGYYVSVEYLDWLYEVLESVQKELTLRFRRKVAG